MIKEMTAAKMATGYIKAKNMAKNITRSIRQTNFPMGGR